jgi:4-hydroxy-tetrahydrodipicolinate synthase
VGPVRSRSAPDWRPFSGGVALVTPFEKNGSLDKAAVRALIDFHVESQTAGIAVAGTTGECSMLSTSEHQDLIATAVDQASGGIHVMAGVGANSALEAVELARFAEASGADSLLSVVPYYVKPTQEGLMRHFLTQADSCSSPLVIYNVPGRTVTDLSVETLVRLAEHPNVIGVKDATGDMSRAAAVREAVPEDFALYSGDDFTVLPYMALGGRGVISVVANVVPRVMAEICRLMDRDNLDAARKLFLAMQPFTRALFAETSPGPVKLAVSLAGYCEPIIRLPLVMPKGPVKDLVVQSTAQVLDYASKACPSL